MPRQPTLTAERVLLRPFQVTDAPDVQRLAGSYEVAATTLNIPHPYEDGRAEAWISSHPGRFERGEEVVFAIVLRQSGQLIGAIGLVLDRLHGRASLGYWVGKDWWNQGYCTEAARAVLRYGFAELRLDRIFATHLARNPASGRVMQKIGMKYEGCLRRHVKKWGRHEDMLYYGILRDEFPAG